MTDGQRLRRRLHEEFGALEFSPAPVLRVTGRGRGIRARRRALPAAPGGVFASGTGDGKSWALAVRNIAADPGTHWCRPAVMFNGRDGDVLFKVGRGVPSFGNPAFLTGIAGFPGVGAAFTQVAPDTTSLHPPPSARIWENLDKSQADLAASEVADPIGAGTVNGLIWHVRTTLGLFGQCYTATLRDPGHGLGQSSECMPVAAPPHTVTLARVPVSGATTNLPGYAGLVSPRTVRLVVSFSGAPGITVRPVTLAGRAYVAFVVPPGRDVVALRLIDAAGHIFFATATVPRAR